MTNRVERGAGFTFLRVTFFHCWRDCFCQCMLDVCFYEEIAEVAWTSICDERFFRKNVLATARRLKYGKVLINDRFKVWRNWTIGDYERYALIAFAFWYTWF